MCERRRINYGLALNTKRKRTYIFLERRLTSAYDGGVIHMTWSRTLAHRESSIQPLRQKKEVTCYAHSFASRPMRNLEIE